MFRAFFLVVLSLTLLSVFVNSILPGIIYSTADTESVRVKLLEDKVAFLQTQLKNLAERQEKTSVLLDDAKNNARSFEAKLADSAVTIDGLSQRLARTACDLDAVSIAAADGAICSAPADEDRRRELSRPRRVDLGAVEEPDENHWKEHSATISGRTLGFWINTHDPAAEDGFVSAHIHAGRSTSPCARRRARWRNSGMCMPSLPLRLCV